MLRSLTVLSLLLIMTAAAVAGDWTETVDVSGDLRYRHEQIDEEGKEMRNRHRVRARIAIDADVAENVSLGFRLASGSADPISTNQTLDDAFTSKNFGLDRAFFAWKTTSGVKFKGGKMGMPFHKVAKNELMWDSDLSPEGIAAFWSEGGLFVNAAGLWIDERSGSENAALMGAQAGFKQATDAATFTVGAGMFNYTNLMGPLYDDDFFGNSSNASDEFMYEFKLIEVFVEAAFTAGETPVTVFADFVKNNEAEMNEQGYIFGAKINKAKKPGTWDLAYDYRELQADAVMGAFANSDFVGGGTDGKGHRVAFGYQVNEAAKLALTYLVNTKGLENGVDYKRLQADMKFNF